MKRLIVILTIISIVFSFGFQVLAAQSERTETHLAPGINLIEITNYTSEGTQNVQVLEIDLTNPRLEIELLSSEKGVSHLENVRDLASADKRIVAAINGDFFAWYKDESGRGSAVGFNVSEGEMLSSPPVEEELASLVFTTSGAVLTQYFRPEFSITSPDGRKDPIRALNKYDPLAQLNVYTPAWGDTFKCSGGFMRVAVVKDDVVTEVVSEEKDVEIPENGYLIAGLADHTDFFDNTSLVNSKLHLDITFLPYFDDVETAIGGGTVLVKNGAKAPITHMRYGRDFRSAAGVSKDGKTLYFITVDGSNGSIGMTLQELQSLMLELNIFDGINFDGGGSTQMVARAAGEDSLRYINNPENGYLRPVINALGIAVNGTAGEADGIIAGADKTSVYPEQSVQLSFTLFDQLYYPIQPDPKVPVSYSFEGVAGTAKGNTFTPIETGTITATVTYGSFTSTVNIAVKEPYTYMDCDKPIYYVSLGENVPVVINTVLKNGTTGLLPLSEVDVTVSDGVASFKNGKLTAIKPGFGTINFTYDAFSFSAYISVDGVMPVDLYADSSVIREDFETMDATALSYPEGAIAEYTLSRLYSSQGNSSGKLKFDFDNDVDALQAAYMVFNNPLPVNTSNSVLTMDIFGSGNDNLVLKGMFTDSSGETKRINLCDDLSFRDKRSIKVDLKDISAPAKLTRIYVVEKEKASKERGSVYFDNLLICSPDYAEYSLDPLVSEDIIPQISITGGIAPTNTLLDVICGGVLEKTLENAEYSYSLDEFTTPKNSLTKGKGIVSHVGDITSFQIDKLTDGTIKSASYCSVTGNVLTVIVTESFDPEKQAQLTKALSKFAADGIRVFVVYKGETLQINTDDDIRYISLPAISPSIITNQKTAVVLDICSNGDNVSYRISRNTLWGK